MTRLSLRPGPRSGLEIPEARGWRIEAAPGGGVVMQQPDEPDVVVAPPGEVARAVVVRGEQVPRRLRHLDGFDDVLALLSEDEVLLAVPLHLLAHGLVTNGTDLRRVSGADDFALALGLTLEPATDEEAVSIAGAGDGLQLGPVREALRRTRTRHAILLAATAVALVAMLTLSGAPRTAAGVVGTLAVAALALEQWLLRSRFLHLVVAPQPGSRVQVPNVLTSQHTTSARTAQLQIGPHDIVHVSRETETWVAGPRNGGVSTCLVGDESIRFVDRHGVNLLVIASEPWIGPQHDDATLKGACDQAGVTYRRGRGVPSNPLDLYEASTSSLANGEIVFAGPFITGVLAFVIAMGHLFPLEDLDPVRVAIAAVAAGAAVLAAGAGLRHRRWQRQQDRQAESRS